MILNKSINREEKRSFQTKIYFILGIFFVILQIQFLYESAPGMLRWNKDIITVAIPFLSFLIVIIMIILKKSIAISVRKMVFFISVLSVSFFSILINQDFHFENLFFVSALITGFLTSLIFKSANYLKYFLYTLIFYSLYSLIATYLLLPLHLSNKLNIFPVYESILGVPFVDMKFSYSVGWQGILRNQGIFREPGVFQFFLLIALAIQMFYLNNRLKNLNIFILSITIISTFSTVGLICLFGLVVTYLIKLKKFTLKGIVLFIGLLSIIIITIISNKEITYRITSAFAKLSEGSEHISFAVRFESVINNLKMSLHNPIFGNSFVNGFHYIQSRYNSFGTNDITGTLFSYIMALGYPIGLIIIATFYKFCRKLSENSWITFIIFIILFLSLNTQNLVYSSLLWTFIFISFEKKE